MKEVIINWLDELNEEQLESVYFYLIGLLKKG